LERGLGRNLFSKRLSPDYFFVSDLVFVCGCAEEGFLDFRIIAERGAHVREDDSFGFQEVPAFG